ncbi:hypothetical protein L9F63_027773, partial [Diploptera punctata]
MQKYKECLRHPCNRKCCDGNCPPCEKPCGRTLRCGNHKCASVCHRGPCYPCPLTAEVKMALNHAGNLIGVTSGTVLHASKY